MTGASKVKKSEIRVLKHRYSKKSALLKVQCEANRHLDYFKKQQIVMASIIQKKCYTFHRCHTHCCETQIPANISIKFKKKILFTKLFKITCKH